MHLWSNKMKTFLEFVTECITEDMILDEAKDDASKEGGASNNTKGVMHELLVGRAMNGGKHMSHHNNEHGETPKQAHDRLKSLIHPADYDKIQANAKSAASHIKAHISITHPGHAVHSVAWTSKPGDTEKVTKVKAKQTEDSSDIYVTTKHPKTGKETHHGVSLKVSDNASKNVPSSSLGMESGGSRAKTLYNKHQDIIKKKHPTLVGKNADDRKAWAEANPAKHNQIKKANLALLHQTAHAHAEELTKKIKTGDSEHVSNHVRRVLAARSTPAAEAGNATFIKHTTYKTAKGVQHHVGRPGDDYEHILKDHKNITVKSSGGSVHFYHKGKKFATQSHKLNSQSDPLSALKSAGKAV